MFIQSCLKISEILIKDISHHNYTLETALNFVLSILGGLSSEKLKAILFR